MPTNKTSDSMDVHVLFLETIPLRQALPPILRPIFSSHEETSLGRPEMSPCCSCTYTKVRTFGPKCVVKMRGHLARPRRTTI
jgi:hypothetical protein